MPDASTHAIRFRICNHVQNTDLMSTNTYAWAGEDGRYILYTFGCDAVASNVQHTLTGTYSLYTAKGAAIIFAIVLLFSFSPHENKPHEAPIYSLNSYFYLFSNSFIQSPFHSESPQKCNCVHRFMFARNTETGYFNPTVTRNDEWIYCEHFTFACFICQANYIFTRHSFIGAKRMKIETLFSFFWNHSSIIESHRVLKLLHKSVDRVLIYDKTEQ